MGNILKVKIALIIFSLAILILIPLLETNFYAPVTYKKWQQLIWDDFQGIAKPFTGWGAGISSGIQVEWDSTAEKFKAYAVQDNQSSWRRKVLNDPDYVLNHEQYHFNITEIHARILNLYLDSIQQQGNTNYRDKLITLKFKLDRMQDAYDGESDHGANWGMQRRWEYKVDSMLHELSDEKGKLTDYFSGAEIFFPTRPDLYKQNKVGFRPSRIYSLIDYGVSLTLFQSRFEEHEKFNLNYEIDNFFHEKSLQILSRTSVNTTYDFEVLVDSKDTTDRIVSTRWIYHN